MGNLNVVNNGIYGGLGHRTKSSVANYSKSVGENCYIHCVPYDNDKNNNSKFKYNYSDSDAELWEHKILNENPIITCSEGYKKDSIIFLLGLTRDGMSVFENIARHYYEYTDRKCEWDRTHYDTNAGNWLCLIERLKEIFRGIK